MIKHNYKGCDNFRMRIALSLMTCEPVKITKIREKHTNPGVNDAEVSLLKLIDELTSGTTVRINDTGTIVTFFPGTITGGEITHHCSTLRGLGYYLEVLLLLAPFSKNPLEARLFGVTNNTIDPSVDMIEKTWFKVISPFIGLAAASALKLNIIKRGVPPKGGGEIVLHTKPSRLISPINKLQSGKVFKIRGIAWTCRVSPGNNHQMIAGAKEVLNNFLSDVYFTKDHRKADSSGESPGFGLVVWAETKEGVFYCAEAMSQPQDASALPVVPGDIGRKAACLLLNEIYCGGCVDTGAQSLALLLMASESGRNASQLLIGQPTDYTTAILRLIRDFLGVKFDLSYEEHFLRQDAAVRRRQEKEPSTLPQSGTAASGLRLASISGSATASGSADTETAKTETAGDELGGMTVSLGADKIVATCFGSGLQHVSQAIR